MSDNRRRYRTIKSAIRNSFLGNTILDICTGQEIYKAITAKNPKACYTAGRDAKMYIRMKGLLSDGLFDRLVLRQFK